MRTTLELARAALSAEILYIRRIISRQINRAIYGAVALVFAIGVLVLLHCVAYVALLNGVSPLVATLILLAFDLVVAAVFGVLALRGAPDRLELEARDLRDRSITGVKQSLALETLMGPVGRIAWRQVRRRRRA